MLPRTSAANIWFFYAVNGRHMQTHKAGETLCVETVIGYTEDLSMNILTTKDIDHGADLQTPNQPFSGTEPPTGDHRQAR